MFNIISVHIILMIMWLPASKRIPSFMRKTLLPAGDVLIGLASSAVHSDGFTPGLARKVIAQSGLSLNDKLPGEERTLGKILLTPTVIYVKQVFELINKGGVKGIVHVTIGGLTNYIPRMVRKNGIGAIIYTDSWEVPTLFKWAGGIEDAQMRHIFNLGIGMVLVMSPETSRQILDQEATGAYIIGEIVRGKRVTYQ